jgi:hypothetical protein
MNSIAGSGNGMPSQVLLVEVSPVTPTYTSIAGSPRNEP